MTTKGHYLTTKFIEKMKHGVNEKDKYVGILSDESPELNCNTRKSHLKLNNKLKYLCIPNPRTLKPNY